MAKRLYIGNLSYNTNDQGLRDAFAEFGNVKDARVVIDRETGRSRGFGFVEFELEAEAANALSQMNGQDLDGRSLRVNEAEERRPSGGGGYRPRNDAPSGGGGGYSGGPPSGGSGDSGHRGGGRGGRKRGRGDRDNDRW